MVTVAEAIERFLETYRSLPGEKYLTATLILVVAWYGSRLLIRFLGRPVARRFQRPSLTKTVLSGVRAIVMVFAASVAANQIGFAPGQILLSVTVFSAVLGLVLAPIIGSVINGLFLLADQPYEIGDMIELVDRDQQGYVEDITLRYTKIFTLENTFLVIPNSNMRDRDVINFSAEDTRSRLSLELLVTYEGDVEEARAIMERAARETSEVVEGGPDIRIGSARYPSAPVSYVKEFADNGILLDLRYWVKDPYYLPRVTSKLNERIWTEIEEADVDIAYPHQHLVFDETSGTASVEISEGGRRGRPEPATDSPTRSDDEERRSPDDRSDGPSPEEFDSPD